MDPILAYYTLDQLLDQAEVLGIQAEEAVEAEPARPTEARWCLREVRRIRHELEFRSAAGIWIPYR